MVRITLEKFLQAVPGAEILQGGWSGAFERPCDDSRQVRSGDAFFAISGERHDGLEFALESVRKGACVVVLEDTPPDELKQQQATLIRVPDVRRALAETAALISPDLPRFPLVGITGTNGKTTTAHLTAAVLREAGIKVAVIGTLGTILDDGKTLPSPNTTPSLLTIHASLRRLEDDGYGAAVLEVSSQGIAQHRVTGLPFTIAVFTNLTPEHMELHADMETYRQVKASFFSSCRQRDMALTPDLPRTEFLNIFNSDDPEISAMLVACRGEVWTFRMSEGGRVSATHIECGLDGSRFRMVMDDRSADVELPLGGRYNVANALAAASVGLRFGLTMEQVSRGLSRARPIPGRFEVFRGALGERALVDYAHTSDGLENLLTSVRPLVSEGGRLTVVFGCGGDRDPSKRPRMGKIAAGLADRAIVTSDNPRSEDPQVIADQILEGVDPDRRDRIEIILDRRAAIRKALSEAGPEDLVIVAGKGHETVQIQGGKTEPFDDSAVVREFLSVENR